MKAISRRLSVATPPETNPKHNASHRDASLRRVRGGTLGVLASILSGCSFFEIYSGGIRFARPPANRGDASGIGSVTAEDLGR
jgi:hypothetical protein